MPGTFTYGLYPFTWHPPETRQVMSDGVPIDVTYPGYHSAPDGAGCLFDLRPISEQAKQGQSSGYGFFAWDNSPPNDLVVLGVGDCRTIPTTPTMQNELRQRLQLSRNPAGATLIDLMDDIMGPLASPDGSTGVRPLMPTQTEEIELHLAGHSRVKVKQFTPAQLLAANPTGHANKIRDVIRTNLDIADAAGKLGEALGAWLMRCGYSREQVKAGAQGKKTEFERLCSTKVRAKYGNSLKPKEPKTTLAELWPTNSQITTGQTYTWAYNSGAPLGTVTFTASGNLVSADNGNSFYQVARCTTAVSADSMWASAPLTITGNYAAGTCVRMNTTTTFYFGYCWYNNERRLRKFVGGTETALDADAHTGGLSAIACRTEADGSTISCQITGYDLLSVTDTAITGNLIGGVVLLPSANNNLCWVGPTTISDGIPDAPVAAFSGTPLSGTAPLSVAFTDASTNTPTSWLWEKSSDGGSNWANFASGPTTQNPTESFTAGTWAVRLTATNAGGADSETKLAYVAVTAAGGAGVSALMLVRGVV